MSSIILNAASLALLYARGAKSGTAEQVGPDQFEVEVDEEVKERLALVHDDPNEALHILTTTGVGHA